MKIIMTSDELVKYILTALMLISFIVLIVTLKVKTFLHDRREKKEIYNNAKELRERKKNDKL